MPKGKKPSASVERKLVRHFVRDPNTPVKAVYERVLTGIPKASRPSVRWVYALKARIRPRLELAAKWYEEAWNLGAFRSQPPSDPTLLQGAPLSLPPDAVPDVLAVATFCLAGGTVLTNRQALWLGRIRNLCPESLDAEERLRWLRVWSSEYALEDRIAHAMDEILNTQALDTRVAMRITRTEWPSREDATASDIAYMIAVALGDIKGTVPVSLQDAFHMDTADWLNQLAVQRLGDIELNDALISLNKESTDLSVNQKQLAALAVRWFVKHDPRWRSFWAEFREQGHDLPPHGSKRWNSMMSKSKERNGLQRGMIRTLVGYIKTGDLGRLWDEAARSRQSAATGDDGPAPLLAKGDAKR